MSMWDELWIEKEVTSSQLAAAVASAHGVAADDVLVIDGIATEASRPAKVEVHRTRGGGSFPVRIQLEGAEPADRRVFCARLASHLACKVLGDDGDINPCTFMLYEPGNAIRVSVDPAKIEAHAPVVVGPYVASDDEEVHLTRPIRRRDVGVHRSTRGGQLAHIVNEYMIEGLPRPPLVEWTPETRQVYDGLHRLLGTLAFRAATPEELANVRTWRDQLRTTFADPERAGWFVVELIEAADLVLTEPWDPERPALDLAT